MSGIFNWSLVILLFFYPLQFKLNELVSKLSTSENKKSLQLPELPGMYMCMHVYVCVHVYINACMCMHVYVCVHVQVCVCVCMCV